MNIEHSVFQLIIPVGTNPSLMSIANHMATHMELDSYYDTNDHGLDNEWLRYEDAQGNEFWVMDSPATSDGRLMVTSFKSNAPYNTPLFVKFRTARGDGLNYRAPVTEADFNYFRDNIELLIDNDIEAALSSRGLTEIIPEGVGFPGA